MEFKNNIIQGAALEVLKSLPDECVDMVMTSPPYWALRDYGVEGQLGLEPTFEEYIQKLCDIFDEAKRVLKKEGTCWVNLGDTYSGSNCGAGDSNSTNRNKPESYKQKYKGQKAGKTQLPDKCLCQIPSRFSIEMINREWILRNIIIWWKPNCMPSSVKDRFTIDFEYLFFFAKNKKYHFQPQYEPLESNKYDRARMAKARTEYGGKWAQESGGAIKTQRAFVAGNKEGRNKRCVWRIFTRPYPDSHFAVYPPELCETPIKAGCPKEGIVLDPFMGSGTTAEVAQRLGRNYLGIELNREYIKLAEKRLAKGNHEDQQRKVA